MDLFLTFLAEYGLFLLKTVTLVFAIVIAFAGIIASVSKAKGPQEKFKLKIESLNNFYNELKQDTLEAMASGPALKKLMKEKKKREKQDGKEPEKKRLKVFVLDFEGDLKASKAESLAHEVSSVLLVAEKDDEVVVKVHSPGGLVSGYGLCASQLKRIRDKGIKLTACVDEVAASGGYLMACVANKIVAAPFSVVGSIGVVSSLPNFSKLLKKNDIDYELHTSGEFKRTLTLFGENTDEGRKKFQEQLDATHELFKKYVKDFRPQVDLEQVSTGEYWYGYQAQENHLVDQVMTSDEYLLEKTADHAVFKVTYEVKESLLKKLSNPMKGLMRKLTQLAMGRWI